MEGQKDNGGENETVLWQSPPGRRARFAAGGKYGNPTRGELRVMISVCVFSVLMLILASGAGAPNSLSTFSVASVA
ncbi:MAG: hypothetical protein IMF08_18565 [Proteobacteria bacterium]|nr:hypothetical protein [Pseudomonadota bacterium]